MAKAFASQNDLAEKTVTFSDLGSGCYAYTAEGDPNTGIVVGDDGVLVVDTQATPVMASAVIERVRGVTDKPIKHIVLSHYHAVRVLGASAYHANNVICSRATRDLICERGEQDYASEAGRFPRLFRAVESIPGLTWPTLTFEGRSQLWLGSQEAQILQPGRGHTKGDTIVWLPRSEILFAGDLVEFGATPYCGDAYLSDWPVTLECLAALRPRVLVPGRGNALIGYDTCRLAIEQTKSFVIALRESVLKGFERGFALNRIYKDSCDRLRAEYGSFAIFDHCMPFNVSRAYDEVCGIETPRIWTAERDRAMWAALEM
ncbi:MAG TPA: MBL fold metallo-hydrolase [Steroidobacteraceae bacterium]|nr:MBL fold metallo-hydrolase [Steroidobacteraceae bacterium]